MSLSMSIRKRLSRDFELEVTLLLSPGITMLFGASGSGKTTLLRAVAGLVTPDTGSIAIGSATVFSASASINIRTEHRNVGYVFQQLALFPHMTIGENIGYGLARTASPHTERIHAIAKSFRIDSLLSRKPADVSGGERQRAALARSLVLDPAVLLLDEPLSALDHSTQSLIIEDLRAWNAWHKIPVLYVTHAHREVFALGERVLAIDHGRIVADGPPSDVLDAPSHEPLARLAGFENFFSASVTARRSAGGTMLCRLPRGVELEVPLAQAASDASIRIAIRAGDILLAVEHPRGLSARNILAGTVEAIRQEGPTVIVDVNAGERFVVHVTPEALQSLGLTRGTPVWLVIKTYSCRVVSS
ncbi:MAG TPA: ATP-binding cassette domain-containing protein [Vicinamibacterales bacterium]|nr:ATP-binding cassette domain-containing protein [Vicinamibacterales bacterium]